MNAERISQVAYQQIVEKANNQSKRPEPKSDHFAHALQKQMESKVKFSKHAIQRINSRGIKLTDSQIEGLEKAVDKASGKGLKESLVMFEDTALIVSVRNKTVITALEKENLKDRVITNVDGVVII